jgi:hypothetical protein
MSVSRNGCSAGSPGPGSPAPQRLRRGADARNDNGSHASSMAQSALKWRSMGAWIAVGVLVAIVVALNFWATARVRDQTDLPASQRRLQLLFIWLLPVIAAAITIEVYRRSPFRRPRQRLVADEIHPLINQALRPLADGETRATERYIENELIDLGHDIGGHGHSDGGHGP